MQNKLNVDGVVVNVGHCGEKVVLKNEGNKSKLVIVGNPREEVASDSFTLQPGQEVKVPKGAMTECRVVVGEFVSIPVIVEESIPLPGLGLVAELLGVTLVDAFVMNGDETLKLVPTNDN